MSHPPHVPQKVAHRGAPRELRENTLPSFLRALERGAEAIELDVHGTLDGVVVVHHDFSLGADTARPQFAGLTIARTPWSTLGKVLYRDGQGLATLAEVLEAVGTRATVYVEVKAPGIEAAVVEVVRAATTPCAVHSFDHRIPRRVHELAPEIPVGILVDGYLLEPARALTEIGARDYWPDWRFCDASLVQAIQGAGGRVVAWTVDDPMVARSLAALGVDGLCANDIRELAKALIV